MVIDRIKREFEMRSNKNPAYSLRAFAKSLDLDSSTLSSLLSGKRKLGFKTAHKILDKLDLSSIERKELLFGSIQPSINDKYKFIEDAQLEIISSWEHYAILSLIETQGFRSSVKFISSKLNIPSALVMAALERLEKVGLIVKKNSQWQLCQSAITTTQDIPLSALRKAHRDYIEKALYSLANHNTEDRDISGITMAINKTKLPQAKRLIQEFRKSLAELLETGKKEEVYRLNIQLYPLKK